MHDTKIRLPTSTVVLVHSTCMCHVMYVYPFFTYLDRNYPCCACTGAGTYFHGFTPSTHSHTYIQRSGTCTGQGRVQLAQVIRER